MGESADPPKPKILLADADLAMMDAIEAAIGRESATFEKAHDGRVALDRLDRFKPDLLIVEANMPKMSGFMVLQKIRKVANERPFVIMTADGCGKRHQVYATQHLGAEAFFHKPVRMRRLVEKVQELLGITLIASA